MCATLGLLSFLGGFFLTVYETLEIKMRSYVDRCNLKKSKDVTLQR